MTYGGGESRGAQTKPQRGPAPSTHAGAGPDGRRPLAARAEAGGSAPVRGKEVEGADWAGARPPRPSCQGGVSGLAQFRALLALRRRPQTKGPLRGRRHLGRRALPPAGLRRLLPLRPVRSPPRSGNPSCPRELASLLSIPWGMIPSCSVVRHTLGR